MSGTSLAAEWNRRDAKNGPGERAVPKILRRLQTIRIIAVQRSIAWLDITSMLVCSPRFLSLIVVFSSLIWTVSLVGAPEPVLDRFIDFQQYRFGVSPREFEYDATGPHGPVLSVGRPLWRTYVDLSAPSPKFVLIQASALSETNHYSLALLRDVQAANLKLGVHIKLLSGNVGRGAGLVWRARDKNSYYAVLPGSQEICLFRIDNGRPLQIAKAKASWPQNEWRFLEVSVQNGQIRVWFQDQLVLEAQEQNLSAAGRVGLITHADITSLFDDFYIQSGPGRIVRKAKANTE